MLPYFYIILPSYIVFAFVGSFFALLYTYFRLDRFKVRFTDFLKIFSVCVLTGFIGGKALFIITQIPQLIMNFTADNAIHLIMHSGFVFYGGLFGVLLTLKIYAKFGRYNEPTIFNLIAPAIPLFHGFGRIGCLFAGCCYGTVFNEPVEIFHIRMDRFPVQAFEAVFEFALFVAILFIDSKKKHTDLLKMYLLSYAVFRFVNEFFRGDGARGFFMGFSTSQWISIAILAYYAVKSMRDGRKSLESA